MFRSKICGLTTPADAQAAVIAGAEALGLNFVAGSPRCISTDMAEAIRAAVPQATLVGVFVDASVAEMQTRVARARLDFVQLHGDEPVEVAAAFPAGTVIKAFRCREANLTPVWSFLAECERKGVRLAGVLLDAYQPGSHGGTGLVLDWELVRRERHRLGDVPLVLAGGLQAANVATAIQTVQPTAVDTASGVESSPGKKDPARMTAFVAAARAAFV